MFKIVNLTQHLATFTQGEAGVFDVLNREEVRDLLTFTTMPSCEELIDRAEELAKIAEASGAKKAMIGGAMFLMQPLERALVSRGIVPVFAFSERVSQEVINADGSVTKTNTFRHIGFVESTLSVYVDADEE